MTGFYQISGYERAMLILIPLLAFLGFLFVLIANIVSSLRKGQTWKKSQESPVSTLTGRVISKRVDAAPDNAMHTTRDHLHHVPSAGSATRYFVAIQQSSGDQVELELPHSEYDKLTDGNEGQVTLQGTRLLHFDHQ